MGCPRSKKARRSSREVRGEAIFEQEWALRRII